jgi:hypothetical protein
MRSIIAIAFGILAVMIFYLLYIPSIDYAERVHLTKCVRAVVICSREDMFNRSHIRYRVSYVTTVSNCSTTEAVTEWVDRTGGSPTVKIISSHSFDCYIDPQNPCAYYITILDPKVYLVLVATCALYSVIFASHWLVSLLYFGKKLLWGHVD